MTAIHAGGNLLREHLAGIRQRIFPKDVFSFFVVLV
jgi:hypothetical protein